MVGDCLALCDMTNVPSKRGIASILGDLLLKSGDDSGKTVIIPREGSTGVKFSKRLCLVVDDLVKESTENTNEGSDDDDNVKESQGETNAVDTVVGRIIKEEESDMTVFAASQTDTVEDSSRNSGSDEKLGMVVETVSVLPNSQNIKHFSMNRCANVEAGDELKSCSCSFCLKAAYIWSDLHYQDIKGRLSVLKKSQKEAKSLIQRNGKGKPQTDIYGSENSNSWTNRDFEIMSQWTSLFLNMESILARKNNHLHNSFVAMKEMRENCKIDLERATKTTQQNNT